MMVHVSTAIVTVERARDWRRGRGFDTKLHKVYLPTYIWTHSPSLQTNDIVYTQGIVLTTYIYVYSVYVCVRSELGKGRREIRSSPRITCNLIPFSSIPSEKVRERIVIIQVVRDGAVRGNKRFSK